MNKNLLRSVCLVLTTVASTVLVSGALRAADEDGTSRHALAIVQDESEGVFRFTIDGYEVARIDSKGLLVAGDVAFTGSMVDVGPTTSQPAEVQRSKAR